MDYISITNNTVDNFIVAEPTAVPGLQAALGCTLIPRDNWPTAERGDQLIDGVLYRDIDGTLTDIRLIQSPEPVEPMPDPLESRIEAVESSVDTIMTEIIPALMPVE